jgi:hypothetical protein
MKTTASGDQNSGLGLPAFAGSSPLRQKFLVGSEDLNSWRRLRISEMSQAVNVIDILCEKARLNG